MNRHLAITIVNFCVVKLRNSHAITRVSRLELDYSNQQYVRPRLNQRFLSNQAIASLFIRGTAESNSFVYSFCGCIKTCSTSPCSTIFP